MGRVIAFRVVLLPNVSYLSLGHQSRPRQIELSARTLDSYCVFYLRVVIVTFACLARGFQVENPFQQAAAGQKLKDRMQRMYERKGMSIKGRHICCILRQR